MPENSPQKSLKTVNINKLRTRCPDRIYLGSRIPGTRINLFGTWAIKIRIQLTGYSAFRVPNYNTPSKNRIMTS